VLTFFINMGIRMNYHMECIRVFFLEWNTAGKKSVQNLFE